MIVPMLTLYLNIINIYINLINLVIFIIINIISMRFMIFPYIFPLINLIICKYPNIIMIIFSFNLRLLICNILINISNI